MSNHVLAVANRALLICILLSGCKSSRSVATSSEAFQSASLVFEIQDTLFTFTPEQLCSSFVDVQHPAQGNPASPVGPAYERTGFHEGTKIIRHVTGRIVAADTTRTTAASAPVVPMSPHVSALTAGPSLGEVLATSLSVLLLLIVLTLLLVAVLRCRRSQ